MQKRNIKQAGGKKIFEFALSSASAEKNAVKVWKRMPRREKKSCKTTRLQSGGTKCSKINGAANRTVFLLCPVRRCKQKNNSAAEQNIAVEYCRSSVWRKKSPALRRDF